MERRKRPRVLTLTLPDTEKPELWVGKEKYPVRNVSEGGIGLWVSEAQDSGLPKGTELKGKVVIGDRAYPVKLVVRHREPRVAGLEILHQSPELAQLFSELLRPATYAMDLKLRGKPGEEDATGYHRLWYAGQNGGELLVWFQMPNRMIVALQVCWLSKWIYRRRQEPAETGFLPDAKDHGHGMLWRPESLRAHHGTPHPQLLKQAAQFLVALPPPLPGNLLWQFLETGEQVYLPAGLLEPQRAA